MAILSPVFPTRKCNHFAMRRNQILPNCWKTVNRFTPETHFPVIATVTRPNNVRKSGNFHIMACVQRNV